MSGESQSLLTALGVGAAVLGMTVALPLTTVATPMVLAALIVEGSSTNQSGAGIPESFGGKFKQGSLPVDVNFRTGPVGIWRALTAARTEAPGDQNTIMSSGWGAANASLLISYLKAADPDNPALRDTTWVLDNNVANPNGGFGTRYPAFALIGVNPIPTPADPGAVVISTAYEYDINGNAPKYILNPLANANSLAAYLNRRLTQADLPMPVDVDGTMHAPDGSIRTDCENACVGTYKDANGNDVTMRITETAGVTYVGYAAEHLPLVQPLIDYGGEPGEKVAAAIEPALTALVDWGYPDSDPLANPGTLERSALFPSRTENTRFVTNFVAGVKEGAQSLTVDDTTETDVPQRESTPRPLRNVLRRTTKFAPGEQAPVKISQRPPRAQQISVNDAVQRLTKSLRPKHTKTQHNRSDAPPADEQADRQK